MFAASSVLVALFLIALVQEGSFIGKAAAEKMYVYTYSHAYLHYKDADGTDHVLDESVFQDSQTSMLDISILYMRSVMYCAESMGVWVFRLSMAAHEISTISQDVFMAYPMSGWAWGGIAQSMDNLLNTIYFVELIYRIQIYIFRFMSVFALPYLLPIGILMRAFPPTRGGGAYVIAFSIAIYLVYPFAYMAAVFSSPYPNLCATPQIPAPSFGENSKSGIAWEFVMWYRAFEGNILDMLGKFSELSSALMTNLCFLPFIAFTIAMTAMQFSNGLFGANIPEIGRGLIKLI
ncbi:Uncharacterised protein [uncultured archaeon]|nr:Uncharacterised protein [uncultured archaeon]